MEFSNEQLIFLTSLIIFRTNKYCPIPETQVLSHSARVYVTFTVATSPKTCSVQPYSLFSNLSSAFLSSIRRHSTKPGVLGDRNDAGHFDPGACPLDLNRFQSQPFSGQRSWLVSSPSGVSTSSSSSVEVARVKKPLNAFMLFMRETRQRAADEFGLKESAVINQVLGRKVMKDCSYDYSSILVNIFILL